MDRLAVHSFDYLLGWVVLFRGFTAHYIPPERNEEADTLGLVDRSNRKILGVPLRGDASSNRVAAIKVRALMAEAFVRHGNQGVAVDRQSLSAE
jgi:hypothetical protein